MRDRSSHQAPFATRMPRKRARKWLKEGAPSAHAYETRTASARTHGRAHLSSALRVTSRGYVDAHEGRSHWAPQAEASFGLTRSHPLPRLHTDKVHQLHP